MEWRNHSNIFDGIHRTAWKKEKDERSIEHELRMLVKCEEYIT